MNFSMIRGRTRKNFDRYSTPTEKIVYSYGTVGIMLTFDEKHVDPI